jgi:chromosomal replication initiator protein
MESENLETKTDTSQLWQTVLGEIELQVSRPNFLTWLKNSRLLEKNEKEGVALVGLPNNFAKEWVRSRYHKIILGSLRNVDGSIKNVDYTVTNQNVTGPAIITKKHKTAAVGGGGQSPLMELKIDPKTNLNPKYLFGSFIVGPSNELAYAAAQAVVREIGKKYNPLFVYGGVGLGKTHLIQAIGNEISSMYKNSVGVLYITSEKFINDVIWAVRNKRMDDVKRKYRDIDVLIVDDIQFIGGKPTTEQEFFYTFNTLHENSKQIIISSDRPPSAIPTLEERLRSRFEGGMIVDISYPEYETRLAILRAKVVSLGVFVEGWVLEQIAATIQRNVRELEGVLNKVIFYEQYRGEKINNKKLEEIISEASRVMPKNITVNDIVRGVADFFEVPQSDITNRSRKQEVVEPRQIAMYLMRDILKLSYPHIGERIGKRDHTTAIHACEKIKKEIGQNPGLNQKVMLIKEKLYRT